MMGRVSILMKRNYIWHIVLILYTIFVFSNSLMVADESSAQSGFLLEFIHGMLGRLGLTAPWLTEHVVRKCAHFGEYTVMGILLYQSMKYLSSGGRGAQLRLSIHCTAAFFIPFVDETLQLFTKGRSGQISDVWLDISGVVFGTGLCVMLFYFIRKVRPAENKRS